MTARRKGHKPWGGRFAQATDPLVESYTASIQFDRRLYKYDIQGSVAHARMLAKCGLGAKAEADKIVAGLREIGGEIERGEFRFDPSSEDIHMAIEGRLIEKVGEAGGEVHPRPPVALVGVNVVPRGWGALSGVGLPIDRRFVARALQFRSLSTNSLDAVSDRDFVIESLSGFALLMAHLSRLG